MTFLESLPLGARFRTESGRTGTLLRAGAMSCRVQWDERKHVELHDDEGNTTVSFNVSGRAQDIAPRTEVVQIADPKTEAEI